VAAGEAVIAVTGATGFLGGHLVEELLRQGRGVRAVVRSPLAARDGVSVARADLMDPTALARAFEGADAVITAAALATPANQDVAENDRINRIGTANVMRAAAEAGVRRVVHVSTVGVYDLPPPWRLRGPIREDHPLVTRLPRVTGAYRLSKARAEGVAREASERDGIALTVVRPCAMFGRGEKNLLPRLARLASLPVLPAPTASFPLVYVGDVAAAIVACLDREETVGKALNLAGPPLRFLDFARAWRAARGGGPRFLPVPIRLPLAYDPSAAAALVGFRSRPLDEALREALS
jgi:nucleoside-diphosphate-sugar epimerase